MLGNEFKAAHRFSEGWAREKPQTKEVLIRTGMYEKGCIFQRRKGTWEVPAKH